MRIFLVGYMGSGKSTVGRLLASELGAAFIDTDHYIEEEIGKPISDIFAHEGQAYFRTLETQAIQEIISRPLDKVVIATGGGLPCSEGMMDTLGSAGIVVYLKASITTITKRLEASTDRPLVQLYQGRRLSKYIRNHLADRRPYYRSADIVVWSRGPVEQVVQRIIRKLHI